MEIRSFVKAVWSNDHKYKLRRVEAIDFENPSGKERTRQEYLAICNLDNNTLHSEFKIGEQSGVRQV